MKDIQTKTSESKQSKQLIIKKSEELILKSFFYILSLAMLDVAKVNTQSQHESLCRHISQLGVVLSGGGTFFFFVCRLQWQAPIKEAKPIPEF